MTPVRTTCPYCGVGCGILARPDGAGGLSVEGDPEHPANLGRLCSKGAALGETVGLEGRLLEPRIGDRKASWDEALDAVANGFSRTVAEHGPDAVAFYLSGQLLTEDYYVANKLMKGFIGSPHVDTNSRLCMSSSVAGHKRAFGSDTVPGCYEDLDEADLIVLVGSNAAWCHPVLFRRMEASRTTRGCRIVTVDPRRSATAEEADLHLGLRAGTDTILFGGLLVHLAGSGALDRDYVARHTTGFAAALERAREIAPDVAATARGTGLSEADVSAFFTLFGETGRVVTCYSQGVNQSAQGTDKVGAIVNCHLATGRIGRPGMGPFSLTGQPNAMGGREVGGLANMLAAHMAFSAEEIDRVGRFWKAPRMVTGEGLKAVELFEAVERGRIRALWIMATNPAVSMPDADRTRAALARLDLLVVSETVASNDTIARGAHVLLPAAAWGEKDGTVTNSERRISRQRASLPLPGLARPDWWIVGEVGRRMGFPEAFAYRRAADVFREHAALTAFENAGTRDLDLGGLARVGDAEYEALTPVQWPVPEGAAEGTARLFASGGFFAVDRRARFVAPAQPKLAASVSAEFPVLLNTGRIRDQWHTMTRTGRSPRLGSHRAVPFLEICPEDAKAAAIEDGGLVRVSSAVGEAVLEARVTDAQAPGTAFAPIHWTAETSSHGRVGAVVSSEVDPFSGQPEAKATPVRVTPVAMALRGFVLSRRAVPLPAGTWWARVAVDGGTGTLFASHATPREAAEWMPALFPEADFAEYVDDEHGVYRCAAFAGERLDAVMFVAPFAERPRWEAVKAMFADAASGRAASSAGRAAVSGSAPAADDDPLVCACFGIGLAAIRLAIRPGGATSPEAIGRALRAGTNCGSCVPELRGIVRTELAPGPEIR